MNIDGSDVRMVSNGDGRTTSRTIFRKASAFFILRRISDRSNARRKPDFSKGFVGVYPSFDIFTAKPDGSDLKQLTDVAGLRCRNNYLA